VVGKRRLQRRDEPWRCGQSSWIAYSRRQDCRHPPVGLNLFVIQGIAPDIPLKELVLGVLPFIVIILLFVVLLSAFPEFALWLPQAFSGRGS
jgi:TRAP-type mannitol/chloroaromatic compound transport system permease large subunit